VPDSDGSLLPKPIAILDWKLDPNAPPKVLVQWSNAFPEDSTWETLSDMIAAYPELHLEDKVPMDGEGDVTYEERLQPNEEVIEAQVEKELDLEETIPQTRAKRTILRPKWLNGYGKLLSTQQLLLAPCTAFKYTLALVKSRSVT
jgi:hypothetical protein